MKNGFAKKLLALVLPIASQQFMSALVSALDALMLAALATVLARLAAFVLRLPVLAVYFVISLDEIIKLPAVYHHYKKYQWVKNLTEKENEQ